MIIILLLFLFKEVHEINNNVDKLIPKGGVIVEGFELPPVDLSR